MKKISINLDYKTLIITGIILGLITTYYVFLFGVFNNSIYTISKFVFIAPNVLFVLIGFIYVELYSIKYDDKEVVFPTKFGFKRVRVPYRNIKAIAHKYGMYERNNKTKGLIFHCLSDNNEEISFNNQIFYTKEVLLLCDYIQKQNTDVQINSRLAREIEETLHKTMDDSASCKPYDQYKVLRMIITVEFIFMIFMFTTMVSLFIYYEETNVIVIVLTSGLIGMFVFTLMRLYIYKLTVSFEGVTIRNSFGFKKTYRLDEFKKERRIERGTDMIRGVESYRIRLTLLKTNKQIKLNYINQDFVRFLLKINTFKVIGNLPNSYR